MSEPNCVAKKPDVLELEPGYYAWCACGYSAKHPFCDGAHIKHGIMPVPLELAEKKTVALCACKATKKPPYCDGSHKGL